MLQIGALVLVLVLSLNLGQSSAYLETTSTCGKRTVLRRPLVTFGEPSYPGQWPWQAALFHRSNGSYFLYACGGVIVSRSYILTAAHCTFPRSKVRPLMISEIMVRVGITNIQGGEHSLQQENIARIDRHEEYLTGSVESDIALLQLAGELEMTDFVRPICLWERGDAENLIVGENGYVAGWGLDEANRLPDLLSHAVMPIVSRKTCRDSDPKYYLRYLFDRKTICAGYRNGTSASAGDSGGGLVVEVDGRWLLRGIVSNGKLTVTRAVDTTNFIVFTDVAYFINWIRTNMELPAESIEESDDTYAACGNKPRPSYQRNRYKQYRERPWFGTVRSVITPLVRLCEAAIINEYFVLAPADRFADRYLHNHSQLEVVFDLDDGSPLSRFRIERILRHENFIRSSRMNNIALLELIEKLTFNYFLQPICLWSSDFGENSDIIPALNTLDRFSKVVCGSNVVVTHSQTYCYNRTKDGANDPIPDFELIRLYGKTKMYLRGVLFDAILATGKSDDIWVFSYTAHMDNWIESKAIKSLSKILSHEGCSKDTAIVSIYQKQKYDLIHRCYAAVITKSLFVTTASCVVGISIYKLRVGTENHVSKIYTHPSFDSNLLTNNVAIAKSTAQLGQDPFCFLEHSDKLSSLELFATTLDFTLSDTNRCAERWLHEGVQIQIDGSHICGEIEFKFSPSSLYCRMEIAGFPLNYEYQNRRGRYLRGILDIGRTDHCKDYALPYVFIDLMFYADWIKEIAIKSYTE